MESAGVPAKGGILESILTKKAKAFKFFSESVTGAAWGLKSFVTSRSQKPGEAHSVGENSSEKEVVVPEEKVMVPVAPEEGEKVVGQVVTEEVQVAPKEEEEEEEVMVHVAPKAKEVEKVVVSVAAEEGEKVVVLVAPKEGKRMVVPMILEKGEKVVVLVAFEEGEKVMAQVDPKEGEGVVVPITLEEGEKVVTPVVAKEGEKVVAPMALEEGERVVFPVAGMERNKMVAMVALEEAGKVMDQVGPKEEEGVMVPMALEGRVKVVALIAAKEGEKVVVPMEVKEGNKMVVLVAALKEGERVVVPMAVEKQEKLMVQVAAAEEGEKVVVVLVTEGEKGGVVQVAPVAAAAAKESSILVRVWKKMAAASTWAKAKLKSALNFFSDTVQWLRSYAISGPEKLGEVVRGINTQLDNLSEKKSVEVQGVPEADSLVHPMKTLVQKVRNLVEQQMGPTAGTSREMKRLGLKLKWPLDLVDGFIELLVYHKQPARLMTFLLVNGYLIYHHHHHHSNMAGGIGIVPEHEDKASMALRTLATLVLSSPR